MHRARRTRLSGRAATLARPQLLVLGRRDRDGRRHAVGRTVPLRLKRDRLIAEHLAAALRHARGPRSRDSQPRLRPMAAGSM
ncbi:hypothetical protein [Streptomyces erythrochromogenes]|uniref:hypothetical protein n=1 Tax=Streptomyces erythrochromogenes TaxID=285574 RepID=UPI00368E03F4